MLRQRRPDKEGNEELEVFIGDAVPNHTNATHVFAKEGKSLRLCCKCKYNCKCTFTYVNVMYPIILPPISLPKKASP